MATLSSSPLPISFFGGFQRLSVRAEIQNPSITIFRFGTKIDSTSLSSRYENAVSSQVRRRLPTVFASDNNPLGGDSLKEKTKGSETIGAEGPPFLTILAGFAVFFLICWIIGSIVMWFIGLIVNIPPSK